MADLFLSNIPYDCDVSELQSWIETQGFPVKSVELIQDLVAYSSPSFAYVLLVDASRAANAILTLDHKTLRGRILQVREDWRIGSAAKAA